MIYRTDIVPTCCSRATLYRVAGGKLQHIFSVGSGGANFGQIVTPSVSGRSIFFARTNQGSGQGNSFFRYDLRSRKLFAARGTSRALSLTWRGDRFLIEPRGGDRRHRAPPHRPDPFTRATRADPRRTPPWIG